METEGNLQRVETEAPMMTERGMLEPQHSSPRNINDELIFQADGRPDTQRRANANYNGDNDYD